MKLRGTRSRKIKITHHNMSGLDQPLSTRDKKKYRWRLIVERDFPEFHRLPNILMYGLDTLEVYGKDRQALWTFIEVNKLTDDKLMVHITITDPNGVNEEVQVDRFKTSAKA